MQNGFDFGDIIDEIIERAYGENSTASDVASARRSIYLTLERWHAQQFNTWRIKTQDFPVADGRVMLPRSVDDILTASCVQTFADGRETETAMTRVSETEYANLTSKDIAGQPTQFAVRRTINPHMKVHPKGRSGRTEMLRVTFIARPDEFTRHGSNTDDLPARWLQPLILSSALDLASKDPQRAGLRLEMLASNAPVAEGIALTNDRQRNSFKMRIG